MKKYPVCHCCLFVYSYIDSIDSSSVSFVVKSKKAGWIDEWFTSSFSAIGEQWNGMVMQLPKTSKIVEVILEQICAHKCSRLKEQRMSDLCHQIVLQMLC